jgi:hypothetical protein
MSLPLAICIPTRNRARLLDRTLRHLSGCTEVFSEIVISDNASTDDTSAVVEAWTPRLPRLRYARQLEDVGAFRNIHAAQSLARQTYVFVLSDDDALIPAAVARAVETLEQDPTCVAVYGGYERADADLATVSGVTLPPHPGLYTRADKYDIARNANMLSFPVARSTVMQRHCFMDGTGFGLLRQITQLLDHGAIEIAPYALYRHAETPERLETLLPTAEYQDGLRADWELFAGSIDDGSLQTTTGLVLVNSLPIYQLAYQVATQQNLPLVERTFLLRHLAYMARADADAVAQREHWECHRLVAAATALAHQRIFISDATRLVIERGPLNIAAMLATWHETRPALVILELDPDVMRKFVAAPTDFLLAEYWTMFEAVEHPDHAAGRIAMADVIKSLRLPGSTGQRVLLGPAGSAHLLRE